MNTYEAAATVVALLASSEILSLAILLYFAVKFGLWMMTNADAERNAYGKKYF